MAPVNRLDAVHASTATLTHQGESEFGDSDDFEITDFEAEMKRLSATNRELLGDYRHSDVKEEAASDADGMEDLRRENAELKARIEELETLVSDQSEEVWQERQREYEMLLEEKSEVIRNLHQKMQDMQESVSLGDTPTSFTGVSTARLGQAEEIMRLKRELEEQRRQLEQDEKDMVGQMRQMELTMAKERAEMARQRQEVQRQQSDLAREIEQSNRDPELRERLNTLRHQSDPKLRAPSDLPATPTEQKSSGLLRRIFG